MRTNGAWPPNTYTHDILLVDGGPRRADVDDLGGNQHEELDPKPQISIEPTAAVVNEQNNHIAALERNAPIAQVWIQFQSGTPLPVRVVAMGNAVDITSFVVTHPATGQVNVFWAVGAIAPQEADPETWPLSAVGLYGKIHPSPGPGFFGVQILIRNTATGAPADGDFKVAIH